MSFGRLRVAAAACSAAVAAVLGGASALADQQIAAGPGSRYLTTSVTMAQGERLTFANRDVARRLGFGKDHVTFTGQDFSALLPTVQLYDPTTHAAIPGDILTNDPNFKAIALGAQEQIAIFFASDGTDVIHPEPAKYFEVPIQGPLPEGLNYIP